MNTGYSTRSEPILGRAEFGVPFHFEMGAAKWNIKKAP